MPLYFASCLHEEPVENDLTGPLFRQESAKQLLAAWVKIMQERFLCKDQNFCNWAGVSAAGAEYIRKTCGVDVGTSFCGVVTSQDGE